MEVLVEQVFVGVYIMFVYLACSLFGLPLYPTLFITGFFKHFIGYYSGIQSAYCKKYGSPGTVDVSLAWMTSDSVYEGLKYFLLYGFVLAQLGVPDKFVPFAVAFTVHIFAEVIGAHSDFIRNSCSPSVST
jgi:hypothetical protein